MYYGDGELPENEEEARKALEINYNEARNSNVPKPPKPGEIMICQNCGKPMYPKDFSSNKTIRKKEFKWQCHYACMKKAEELCDLKTVGLLAERQALANKYKEPVHKYRLPNK